MTIARDTMTLFNKKRDGRTGTTLLIPTVFRGGCLFSRTEGAHLVKGGAEVSREARCLLFEHADNGGKPYLPAHLWEALRPGGPVRPLGLETLPMAGMEGSAAISIYFGWTLQAGDYFIQGEVSGYCLDLASLKQTAGEENVYAITSFSDSLAGSSAVRHYVLEGK